MCGIAGALALDGRPLRADRLKPMADAIAHRGPDDAGYYLWSAEGPSSVSLSDAAFRSLRPDLEAIDGPDGSRRLDAAPWSVLLGHRRLSIIDLSPAGHQPMTDASGQLSLVYNGELYNFLELRGELEGRGHSFRGRSDTEVLLEAYRAWGIGCIERLEGMFAFALWDARDGVLHLARDRCGVKPLYLREWNGALLFASEVKSILAYGAPAGVDLLALDEYFSFQNVLSRRTLFEDVELLPPGHVESVQLGKGRRPSRRYWDLAFSEEEPGAPLELRDRLVALLGEAVTRQCVSDVPVASYLSGGMDSGTITAVASRHLGRIRTFTIGYDLSEAGEDEIPFDERALARRMAEAFDTEHHERELGPERMEAVMDRLTWHLEDLRVGQSYPNWHAAELAASFGKVVLAGTGGDELFGGYPWRYAAALGSSREEFLENSYRYWQRLVRDEDKPRFFQPDVRRRLADLAGDETPHTRRVFEGVFLPDAPAGTTAEQLRQALYFEFKTFLHGLLVVEDKLSMAHSLETRVPLLDDALVAFACRIPVELKVSGLDSPGDATAHRHADMRGKAILREAMGRILPQSIAGARKQGFSGPDASWLRGSAQSWARGVLLDPAARIHEYLDRSFVEEVLREHGSGRANRRLLIWSLLSFEKWLQRFL